MTSRRRVAAQVATLLAGVWCLLALTPGSAAAHPLGNASVNHYDELVISPSSIVDHAVVDIAELPTFQRQGRMDRDGDGALTAEERSDYAAAQCSEMAQAVSIELDGRFARPRVTESSYEERPGQASLTTGRLECTLHATIAVDRVSRLSFDNEWDSSATGWHEIVARGSGVTLQDSPFPERSVSDELRAYPGDLLSAPLDVRKGVVTVVPGAGRSSYQRAEELPVAGFAARALNRVSTAFNGTVGQERLTVTVGLLGVLLALLLGAGHALLPGHGKTVMAAYLVGRQGRLRDVVTVGASVTITHTAGVLVLGLLLTSGAAFAPSTVERYLGMVSGLLIVAVGAGLLLGAVRRRHTPRLAASLTSESAPDTADVLVGAGAPITTRESREATPAHRLTHQHGSGGEHGHDAHPHGSHGHVHRHGLLGRAHAHSPDAHTHDRSAPAVTTAPGFSRSGLVGLGLAGGLVPSPSALLVLVAATALGRTAFGVVLVLAYGLGMAFTLCLAGLLLVKLRGRLGRLAATTRLARADKVLAALPILTALLVIGVGAGLALRAGSGSP